MINYLCLCKDAAIFKFFVYIATNCTPSLCNIIVVTPVYKKSNLTQQGTYYTVSMVIQLPKLFQEYCDKTPHTAGYYKLLAQTNLGGVLQSL